MSTSIEKLTTTLTDFITESGSRSTRLETNQEHLTIAITNMTNIHSEISKSNIRLEEKIVSLEAKALDKLTYVEESLNATNIRVSLMCTRVSTMELSDANQAGRDHQREQTRKFWADNWLKFVMAFALSTPVVAGIYMMINNTPLGG